MKGALVTIGLAAVLVVALLAVLAWLDPGAQAEREVRSTLAVAEAGRVAGLGLLVKRIWLVTLAAAGVALAIALVGGAVAFVRWSNVRAVLVHARHALYPAVAERKPGRLTISAPVNEPKSQVVAALTNGVVNRLPAGAVKPIINPAAPADALLPEPAPRGELTADRAVDVDLIQRPHWLIVGQTGSGKSTAARYILAALAARYPAEFVICEPGGVDWNSQANARSERGIAAAVAAVYAELERRQERLRRADLQHVSQLHDTPYVVLVVEEMEAVLDNLRELDRAEARDTLVRLRNIARLGRKAGIALVAVTQAARTDVFDSHVRTNLANVLLFRNSQTTAEMFRLKDVSLPSLPTGTAYSPAHAAFVRFPQVSRPSLPASALYHEDEDGDGGTGEVLEAVRVGVRDQTAVFVAESGTVGVPVPPSVPGLPSPSVTLDVRIARVPKDAPVSTIEDSETLYTVWQLEGENLSAAERRVYGYDGGMAHYWAAPAVNWALRRRGQAARYKEKAA